MATLIVATGAIIIFTVNKIHDRKEKKRALKAQEDEDSQHGLVEEASPIDGTGTIDHSQMGNLPPYFQGNLPPYHKVDQHPAFKTKMQSRVSRSPRRWHLRDRSV